MISVLASTLLAAESNVVQWVLLGALGIVLLLVGIAVIAYFGLFSFPVPEVRTLRLSIQSSS